MGQSRVMVECIAALLEFKKNGVYNYNNNYNKL